MTSAILLATCLTIQSTYAQSFFTVKEVKLNLQVKQIETKLNDTLGAPEKLLKNFTPAGAKITKKTVSNNHISFLATKSVLLISKTVLVNGVLESQENNNGCAKDEFGHDIKFDFAGSDALVYDNIDSLEVKLCTKQINENMATVTAKPRIIKGRNYSNTLGGIARDMIEAQITPLVYSLKTTLL